MSFTGSFSQAAVLFVEEKRLYGIKNKYHLMKYCLDITRASTRRQIRHEFLLKNASGEPENHSRFCVQHEPRVVFTTYSLRITILRSSSAYYPRACLLVPPIIVMTMLSRRRSLSRSRDPRRA